MRVCCVKTCKSSSTKKRNYSSSFFSVPAVISYQCKNTLLLSEERRKRWLRAIKLTEATLKKYHKVCNRHFYTGLPSKLFDNSNVDWVPSLFLDKPPPPLGRPVRMDCNDKGQKISQPSTSKQNQPIESDNLELRVSFQSEQDESTLENLDMASLRDTSLQNQLISNGNEQETNFENDDMEIFEPVCVIKEEPTSEWTEPIDYILPSNLRETCNCQKRFEPTKTSIGIQTETLSSIGGNITPLSNNNLAQTLMTNNIISQNILPKPFQVCLKSELDAAKLEIEKLRNQLKVANINLTIANNWRGRHLAKATNHRENETQTIFRVCLKFELESANFEIDKLKDKLKNLDANLAKANTEIRILNGKIGEEKSKGDLLERETRIKSFHKEFFSENNEKVKFFTGLETLDSLSYVSNHIAAQLFKSSKLTPFQQCVLTLMKMRLAPNNNLLMYIFDIASITVLRIFSNCLKVLHGELFELVKWPERKSVLETTPPVVKERFGSKFVTIVDYLEIMADKRVSDDEKKPNYSKHSTIKYLIAFTPLGAISFVSKGYDGPFTFQDLISQSGLLEKHSQGDIILSNRRIDTEELGFYCATVNHSCQQTKAQLEPYPIDSIREIKIHVDKVINYLRKKYTILQSKFYTQVEQDLAEGETSIVDKMVHVACALTNLCPTVVPNE